MRPRRIGQIGVGLLVVYGVLWGATYAVGGHQLREATWQDDPNQPEELKHVAVSSPCPFLLTITYSRVAGWSGGEFAWGWGHESKYLWVFGATWELERMSWF